MESSIEIAFDDVPEGKHVMAVMGKIGDTKHIWDPRNETEKTAARELFEKLTRGGYSAFHVIGKDGHAGEQMHAFDPNAGKVIFVPPMQGG